MSWLGDKYGVQAGYSLTPTLFLSQITKESAIPLQLSIREYLFGKLHRMKLLLTANFFALGKTREKHCRGRTIFDEAKYYIKQVV